jgi:hypothetical protein
VFRENEWSEDPRRDPAAVVVNVRQPEIEHKVRISDFENWLESPGRSPAEMALKSRLRTILEGCTVVNKIGNTKLDRGRARWGR